LFRPDNTTARLALTPPSLDFGKIPIGVPMQLGASVQNTGSAQLNGSATVSNSPAFSLVSEVTYGLGDGASSPNARRKVLEGLIVIGMPKADKSSGNGVR